MIKKISLGLIVILLVILGLAASKPDTFTVQRSATIKAPPEKIVAYLNDFHNWQAWSPWEKLDPKMQRTFEGPQSGKGAVYAWNGNDEVGQGRMEIIDNASPAKVGIKLEFIRPFASQNSSDFSLQPNGDGTQVNWSMSGPMPFVSKLMSVFVSMDKMIGKDFEKGLAQLKTVAEK
ncbi:SRPBCC family protein [Pseudoduganella violacea]|uniref:Polyketide cyclase n=1 Tax=Pseudoduganella violacea TaxID=1715466 RepID=A0A7W5BDV6_9BURK|nr:SRPBCC family protein [Pseudoduganella violacea]MBB3121337.1 hypothetical protein [Pseudoduganella violacea]